MLQSAWLKQHEKKPRLSAFANHLSTPRQALSIQKGFYLGNFYKSTDSILSSPTLALLSLDHITLPRPRFFSIFTFFGPLLPTGALKKESNPSLAWWDVHWTTNWTKQNSLGTACPIFSSLNLHQATDNHNSTRGDNRQRESFRVYLPNQRGFSEWLVVPASWLCPPV